MIEEMWVPVGRGGAGARGVRRGPHSPAEARFGVVVRR